jgi:hypothetical protein
MGILLLILGLLAALSGGAKLRARTRSRVGAAPLAVAEATLGAGMVLGSGAGLARLRPLAWALVGLTAIVIMLSAASHLRRLARLLDRRTATEGERFKRFVGEAELGNGGAARR